MEVGLAPIRCTISELGMPRCICRARWSSSASATISLSTCRSSSKALACSGVTGRSYLPAQLLYAIVVDVAELLDGNFCAADRGDGRAAKAAENVVDAPNREAKRQQPHDHTHDRAAVQGPIGGGFANTSKHFILRWF